MTLGFKQQFPWATKDKPAPTNFREKILSSCKVQYGFKGQTYYLDVNAYNQEARFSGEPEMKVWTPKIHTMRADPTNRWKAGRKIEMVYHGAGYKIIDHFNKGIPELEVCTGVQQIKLKWIETKFQKREIQTLLIFIDQRSFPFERYDELFANDGFDSTVDFFRWFNKDWEGKIIHWTDFRY